nr:hypothetical protein [uncultured Moraxella sp.]
MGQDLYLGLDENAVSDLVIKDFYTLDNGLIGLQDGQYYKTPIP